MADLDILLTDAFLTLGCHLSAGCVNPVTIEAEWFAKRGNVDVSSVLEQALRKKQIREALIRLRPEQDSYARLRQALAQYRGLLLKGEWPRVPAGPSLKKNMRSERVVELKKRLAASDDLDVGKSEGGDLFDGKPGTGGDCLSETARAYDRRRCRSSHARRSQRSVKAHGYGRWN